MADDHPTAEQAVELFQAIERLYPSTLGEERWYIVAVSVPAKCYLPPDALFKLIWGSYRQTLLSSRNQISAVTGGGQPEFAANLYSYLIEQPRYQTSESRKALIRRLRESLVKLVSVVGIPKPLEAIFCITEVERDEDKDYSFSR